MVDAYNKGARHLPPLEVGDKVRVQNQTTTRTTKWDRTGVITATLANRKYEIMMDGSRCLTTRNRRHLRKIPGKIVVEKEEESRGGRKKTMTKMTNQKQCCLQFLQSLQSHQLIQQSHLLERRWKIQSRVLFQSRARPVRLS